MCSVVSLCDRHDTEEGEAPAPVDSVDCIGARATEQRPGGISCETQHVFAIAVPLSRNLSPPPLQNLEKNNTWTRRVGHRVVLVSAHEIRVGLGGGRGGHPHQLIGWNGDVFGH